MSSTMASDSPQASPNEDTTAGGQSSDLRGGRRTRDEEPSNPKEAWKEETRAAAQADCSRSGCEGE